MLDAKVAKEIADKKKKLAPYLKQIEKMANSGHHSIVFDGRLDKEVKEELRNLGFKVSFATQYREEPLGSDIPFDLDKVSWD